MSVHLHSSRLFCVVDCSSLTDHVLVCRPSGSRHCHSEVSHLFLRRHFGFVFCISIPLSVLCQRSSRNFLADVVTSHKAMYSTHHKTLGDILLALYKHQCINCPNFYCIVEPTTKAATTAERTKAYYDFFVEHEKSFTWRRAHWGGVKHRYDKRGG